MRKLSIILIMGVVCFATHFKPIANELVGGDNYNQPYTPSGVRSTVIGPIGDIRAILGPQGKSIAVCQHGDVVGVIYGGATGNAQNPMDVRVAYSLDSGATWTIYGPFTGQLRRIYPGIDGTPDFCTTPGSLFFGWQNSPFGYNSGDIKTMIEENIPSAPSFSTALSLPGGTTLFPWMVCMGVAPDDSMHIMASAWSYLNGGDLNIYVWISEDGGYAWSNAIPVVAITNADSGNTGHFRFGTGGYVAFTYHNSYNGIEWPFLIESTDGGYTWLTPTPLPVPYYQSPGSQFWWHEMDLEVIDNKPWTIHTDMGTDSIWLFQATSGSPGSWTWQVYNVRQLSWDSTWKNPGNPLIDTLYLCYAVQYPSIAYDPVSGLILAGAKFNYYRGDTIEWADYNGAHVGGIYTLDNGQTWNKTFPLSSPNTGQVPWADMGGVEIAHRLVNIPDTPYPRIYSYTVWYHATAMQAYFDRGRIISEWPPSPGVEEQGAEIAFSGLNINPSITKGICYASFKLNGSTDVRLKLFDITGRNIGTVFNGSLEKGGHKLMVNTSELPNGTYFLSLETDNARSIGKFVVAH